MFCTFSSVNDGKYSATSNVTIEVSVSDENDNIPSFDPANYEVSIPVDHPRGTSEVCSQINTFS